ncbi:MAG: polysaccharide deacetylase family protein [Candidatus Manganitrophus sp. SB1]|nr:polysaccharide deacetylase family protein [Candidatus Manganitrophus morganii]
MRSLLKRKLQRGIKWMVRLFYPFYLLIDFFRRREEVRILMYHKVSNLPPEREVPYCNVPVASFETQMRFLAKSELEVVALDDLGGWLEGGSFGRGRKKVVITFDDGFQDNYLYAAPILRRHQLPATFFVITGAIGRNAPFDHLQWDESSLADQAAHPEPWLPMTWGMLGGLKEQGHTIGSHTWSHRSLAGLTRSEVWNEIAQSKKELESGLQTAITLFSYPFGSAVYGDLNEGTEEALREAGYRFACTTKWGANLAGERCYRLKRIPVYDHDTLFDFKCKVVGAADWVGWLKDGWQKRFRRDDKTEFIPTIREEGREISINTERSP